MARRRHSPESSEQRAIAATLELGLAKAEIARLRARAEIQEKQLVAMDAILEGNNELGMKVGAEVFELRRIKDRAFKCFNCGRPTSLPPDSGVLGIPSFCSRDECIDASEAYPDTSRCHFCEQGVGVERWDDVRGVVYAHLQCMVRHSHACPPRAHRCVFIEAARANTEQG